MTWRQFIREIERTHRRSTRERERQQARAARDQAQIDRQLEREERAWRKEQEKRIAAEEAQDQAARFEEYLIHLHSLHKHAILETDWTEVLTSNPPEPPQRASRRESDARRKVNGFQPTLMQRLTGGGKRQLRDLERAVEKAAKQDESEHDEAMRVHEQDLADHESRTELANGVLRLELSSLQVAIRPIQDLEDFAALGLLISVQEVTEDGIAIDCKLEDEEVVPTEIVGLTSTGKASKKKMPKSRYWDIFQDFACSCVLRIAREAFGTLPISRVVVNVEREELNTATGHVETNVLIGAHITRQALSSINLSAVDPSDSMVNFNHRMEFRKTTGFKPVERVTLSENWVDR